MNFLRAGWAPALGVAAAALAAQAIALRDVLLWDDVLLLAADDLYTNASRWTESVTTTLGDGATYYWRPAATTTFLAGGGAAAPQRALAALLHAGAAAAAYALLARLLASPRAALVAALAFAVHPVNAETVTWISARFDLLAGLFALLALLALPRTSEDRGRVALSATATLLACCSKENAFVLPLLAVAWARAVGAPPRRALVAAGAGVAVALFLRFEALGYLFRARPASVEEAGSLLQHMLLVGRSTATSLAAIAFPWGVVGPAHHAARPVPPDDALGWSGVALGVALLAVAAITLRRRPRLGWLLAAFVVSLAPASQIVPLDLAGGLHAADRFLYLPSFFAVAAAAEALAPLAARRAMAGRAAVALVVALAAWRVAILPRWNDPVRFWTWAASMAPDADVAQANLAEAHLAAGDPGSAIGPAARAGAIGVAYLAEALGRLGRWPDAVHVLGDALARRPGDPWLLVQRGEACLETGDASAALADFDAAARIAGTARANSRIRVRSAAGAAESLARMGDADAARRRLRDRPSGILAGPRGLVRLARAWLAIGDVALAAAMIGEAEAAGAPPEDLAILREDLRKLSEGK